MQTPTFDAVLRLAQALPQSAHLSLIYGLFPSLLGAVLAAADQKVGLTPRMATPETVRALFAPLITEGDAAERQATLELLLAIYEDRDWLAEKCWIDMEPHARPQLETVLPLAQALPRSDQVRLAHALLPQAATSVQLLVQYGRTPIIEGKGTPESLAALFRSWREQGDMEEERETVELLMEAFGETGWLDEVPEMIPGTHI